MNFFKTNGVSLIFFSFLTKSLILNISKRQGTGLF